MKNLANFESIVKFFSRTVSFITRDLKKSANGCGLSQDQWNELLKRKNFHHINFINRYDLTDEFKL